MISYLADSELGGCHDESISANSQKLMNFIGLPVMGWGVADVWAWLQWCCREYSIEAVEESKFNMNGKALCMLTKADFCDRVPSVGDLLYNTLHTWLQPGDNDSNTTEFADMMYSPKDHVMSTSYDLAQYSQSESQVSGSHANDYQQHTDPSTGYLFEDTPLDLSINKDPQSYNEMEHLLSAPLVTYGVVADETSLALRHLPVFVSVASIHDDINSPLNLNTAPRRPDATRSPTDTDHVTTRRRSASQSLHESESDVTNKDDCDLDFSDEPMETSSSSEGDASDSTEMSTSMIDDGADVPEISSGFNSANMLNSVRRKRGNDNTKLLWEFIYEILSGFHGFTNRKLIRWVDADKLMFCVTNPMRLAVLWGQQKARPGMTYDKLARALRYYYKMNIVAKVKGKKLTYRFIKHPTTIQRGQRGAKPGVPHHRRVKKPNEMHQQKHEHKPNEEANRHRRSTIKAEQIYDEQPKQCHNHAIDKDQTCNRKSKLSLRNGKQQDQTLHYLKYETSEQSDLRQMSVIPRETLRPAPKKKKVPTATLR